MENKNNGMRGEKTDTRWKKNQENAEYVNRKRDDRLSEDRLSAAEKREKQEGIAYEEEKVLE